MQQVNYDLVNTIGQELKCVIPSYLVDILRYCRIRDTIILRNIDDQVILDIEKCLTHNRMYLSCSCVGGNVFKFYPGDQLMLKQIATYLKNVPGGVSLEMFELIAFVLIKILDAKGSAQNASLGQFPHTVQINVVLVKDGFEKLTKFQCGGSLIEPSWVLTAAHCLDEKAYLKNNSDKVNKISFVAKMGTIFILDEKAQVRFVEKVHFHPNYHWELEDENLTYDDVALGKLNKPFLLSPNIQLIKLAPPSVLNGKDVNSKFTNCTTVGYGRVGRKSVSLGYNLRFNTIFPLSWNDLPSKFHELFRKLDMFGASSNFSEDMVGDPGSAVVCDQYQLGLVWQRCRKLGDYNVSAFVSVDKYDKFILGFIPNIYYLNERNSTSRQRRIVTTTSRLFVFPNNGYDLARSNCNSDYRSSFNVFELLFFAVLISI